MHYREARKIAETRFGEENVELLRNTLINGKPLTYVEISQLDPNDEILKNLGISELKYENEINKIPVKMTR